MALLGARIGLAAQDSAAIIGQMKSNYSHSAVLFYDTCGDWGDGGRSWCGSREALYEGKEYTRVSR